MALVVQTKVKGTMRWSIHTFEQPGDELPVHTHPDGRGHLTVVTAGEFMLLGAMEGQTAKAGDVLYWDAGVAHGMRALSPNAQFVNSRPALPSDDRIRKPD